MLVWGRRVVCWCGGGGCASVGEEGVLVWEEGCVLVWGRRVC